MSFESSYQERSYQRQADTFKEHATGEKRELHAKTWLEKDTVDAWRHQRMHQVISPILSTDRKARWLTVGDGRYGREARFIIENGSDALASDICDILLKEATDSGYISEFKKENAESLSFRDNEFDYVFCKESYHHFPRPMVALYEMLRVARKGVCLIEPNDVNINNKYVAKFIRKILNFYKRRIRKPGVPRHAFEESGNYVFCISREEIEKVALGLDYKLVAFKGINDAYSTGVEYEKISENGPLQKKVKKSIRHNDFLCRLGLKDYGMLAAVILKHEPSEELIRRLADEGYQVVHIPKNPYCLE
jgi:ubiquinone/menaquinone biosynthesis C-methylase UbiE